MKIPLTYNSANLTLIPGGQRHFVLFTPVSLADRIIPGTKEVLKYSLNEQRFNGRLILR